MNLNSLNTLYNIAFCRNVDDAGVQTYEPVLKHKGAWYVYNILIKSKEFEHTVKKINDESQHFNVCSSGTMNPHVGLVPSVVTIACEKDFDDAFARAAGRAGSAPLYVVPATKMSSATRVFRQRGTIAFLLSGFPRFDAENELKHHQNNVVDVYGSFWNVNDVHGTNYHNNDEYERRDAPSTTASGYKKMTTHDIKAYDTKKRVALLCEEPHILPRVKSMYNGVRHSINDYDGRHDLVVRSRSDVRVFDFLDARDGRLFVNDVDVGPLSDDVVYIPKANYKHDVDVITDMIAMGNSRVMSRFKDVATFVSAREKDLNIPRVPELILYEFFHVNDITVVPLNLRYKVMRVVDFGERGHSRVHLGCLYGTCRVEYVDNSPIVQILNDNGQRFGHNCGVLSFSYTHNHGDDMFVVHGNRIYTTNLDIIFPLHMKENHMIYLSRENSTRFEFDGDAVCPHAVSKKNLDIVVSRYDENLEWCKPYADMCVVYNKGEPLKNNFGYKIRHLKNVGRESHTYLSHIVCNWESMNEYTLFVQGGHIGHGQEKPHMFEGIDIDDYINIEKDVVLFLSARQNRKTCEHWLREGYQGEPEWYGTLKDKKKRAIENRQRLGALMTPEGFWNSKNDTKGIRISPRGVLTYPNASGGSVLSFHWCPAFKTPAFEAFWHDLFGSETACPDVLYYTQGAQFKVHRDVIKRRPIEFYKKLLKYVSHSVNPNEGYFCELIWYYVFHFFDA